VLTRTANMTEAFFKCFPTVAHFAGQLDQKTPCGVQARSFITFYERDASDEKRRAFIDKVWERQREIGQSSEEEHDRYSARTPEVNGPRDQSHQAALSDRRGEGNVDSVDGLPLALQPPFISHLLMGTCFYLGGLLEYLRKSRKSVYVVETETCDQDIMGIPAWLQRESEHQLPAVSPVHVGDMPHHNDTLTPRGRLLLVKALAPEYFANDVIRRLSVNKGSSV